MPKGNQKILESRASLELFTREQIIGPGAFNKRYFLLNEWRQNEFNGKKLETCIAFDNVTEIVSEVPAYQYSSAILFPKSIESDEEDEGQDEPAITREEDDVEGEGNARKADDENFRDDHTENTSSKNQNYPNTCGLSFSVLDDTNLEKDLNITLQFRTYRRVTPDECREKKLGYWVSENQDKVERLVLQYLSAVFATETVDGNLFIYVKASIDVTEFLHDIDYKFLEQVRVNELVPMITAAFPKKEMFKHAKKKFRDADTEYTSIYEDTLIAALTEGVKENPQNYKEYQDLIQRLEVYNQLRNAVTELKTIYRKPSARSKPTPIYQSTFLSNEIIIPSYDGDGVVRSHVVAKQTPSLWIYYQYMRSKQSKNVYVKLIVVNKNTVKLKRNEPPQLNKKNEANEKSFFGVQIKVSERSGRKLVPYNPPNLLPFDEEQNFSKLIYRQYEDYGEGHNTSVDWGMLNNKRFVSTEFLPTQDIPKVDFRPSKISNGKVNTLINESVLEFRRHSTLSTIDNRELLNDLRSFALDYKKWISERKNELASSGLGSESTDILERQLKGCEVDQSRIERNIDLLDGDSDAMIAFRAMNTAMFMQLHHGNSAKDVIKNRSTPFVPTSNTEDFYKGALVNYKWRSFQLAFILLNIDAFVKPNSKDTLIKDVFGTGWPERNELADLVWFPTGGGKTEAYLGLIAFCIAYRRFTKGDMGNGTTVLMRYTLRLLTLQQFQRATLLICALEVMRKEKFPLPDERSLGTSRITIGLFVGRDSSPNRWEGDDRSMAHELELIQDKLKDGKEVTTKLPHTECPWCGGALFVDELLTNVLPKPEDSYGINDSLRITCNTRGCAFHHTTPLIADRTLPFRLFDEDIYKFPPTLLFGTVDKFAALANRVSTATNDRNADSRRLFGKGVGKKVESLPPELIIQDELHLLLGPLGSAVGLFEKAVDSLCTYEGSDGKLIRPKIITSTATTRNTDKQIFAVFERRSEIFPKQGITCDDSFFSFYERREDNVKEFDSDRRYIGLLPSGKTQVWMQLRIASIAMTHRLTYMSRNFSLPQLINGAVTSEFEDAFDYFHTILSYFNSLKEVGKTQSQLGHYLPGDINLITGNVLPWSFLDRLIRKTDEVSWGELTGRLTGERVKTSMKKIESRWKLLQQDGPPEFVISTNMISVGIDISRLNVMIVNSMPRNTAEYIQASSRVARKEKGLVFTVHHPFRSRDISHYQRFKEFHEKFYGFVEPISVTPFASKALERYLAMYIAVIARHNFSELANNAHAINIDQTKAEAIRQRVENEITRIRSNADRLDHYLKNRSIGQKLNLEGIIGTEEFQDVLTKSSILLFDQWLSRRNNLDEGSEFVYRHEDLANISLFNPGNALPEDENWNVKVSLREIAPSIVIKTVQQ